MSCEGLFLLHFTYAYLANAHGSIRSYLVLYTVMYFCCGIIDERNGGSRPSMPAAHLELLPSRRLQTTYTCGSSVAHAKQAAPDHLCLPLICRPC
jgi:hypothetical protein